MSYTEYNYKTKKKIQDDIKEGKKIYCFNPGIGGNLSHYTGSVYLEGPHFPEPHKWYGAGKLVNGVLISIK